MTRDAQGYNFFACMPFAVHSKKVRSGQVPGSRLTLEDLLKIPLGIRSGDEGFLDLPSHHLDVLFYSILSDSTLARNKYA